MQRGCWEGGKVNKESKEVVVRLKRARVVLVRRASTVGERGRVERRGSVRGIRYLEFSLIKEIGWVGTV